MSLKESLEKEIALIKRNIKVVDEAIEEIKTIEDWRGEVIVD